MKKWKNDKKLVKKTGEIRDAGREMERSEELIEGRELKESGAGSERGMQPITEYNEERIMIEFNDNSACARRRCKKGKERMRLYRGREGTGTNEDHDAGTTEL